MIMSHVKAIAPGLIMVERDTPEWDYMWGRLADLPVNAGLPQPTVAFHDDAAEAWQYMGTERHGSKWLHCFRHRCHPRTNGRLCELIPASTKKGGK